MESMTLETATVKASRTRYGLRAPKGGCTVAGKAYRGGQFCLPYDEANPHGQPAAVEPVRTAINGFTYEVSPVRIHPEVGSVAFRMTKLATNNTYHVHRDIFGETRCDCPDFEFNRSGTGRACKHARRLIELGLVEASAPRRRRPPLSAVPRSRPRPRPAAAIRAEPRGDGRGRPALRRPGGRASRGLPSRPGRGPLIPDCYPPRARWPGASPLTSQLTHRKRRRSACSS